MIANVGLVETYGFRKSCFLNKLIYTPQPSVYNGLINFIFKLQRVRYKLILDVIV